MGETGDILVERLGDLLLLSDVLFTGRFVLTESAQSDESRLRSRF